MDNPNSDGEVGVDLGELGLNMIKIYYILKELIKKFKEFQETIIHFPTPPTPKFCFLALVPDLHVFLLHLPSLLIFPLVFLADMLTKLFL